MTATNATETFQQIFAGQIANLIYQAYTSGVLQYHPMTLAGITVQMDMFRSYNLITLSYQNRTLQVNMYDEDSEDAQFASIQNTLADIIV